MKHWLTVFLLVFAALPAHAVATTVADGESESAAIRQLSPAQLQELVGPIALYPDDLLAVLLPAATYPLQVVQAARFLDERGADAELQPSPAWDDSVVALLNYPEALHLLNDDLDWTWRLGQAVLERQPDVINAISQFRHRARVAGNLRSDEHQVVDEDEDGEIAIRPAAPDVVYVPYYEPSEVTVYQRSVVYHYYPRSYPSYYYPYPDYYAFSWPYFWGVTSVFSIGWSSQHLHLHTHRSADHPYYGYRYYHDRYYYPRWADFGYPNNYRRVGPHERGRARPRQHAGNFWRGEHGERGARPYRAATRAGYDANRRQPDRGGRHDAERSARGSTLADGGRNVEDRRREPNVVPSASWSQRAGQGDRRHGTTSERTHTQRRAEPQRNADAERRTQRSRQDGRSPSGSRVEQQRRQVHNNNSQEVRIVGNGNAGAPTTRPTGRPTTRVAAATAERRVGNENRGRSSREVRSQLRHAAPPREPVAVTRSAPTQVRDTGRHTARAEARAESRPPGSGNRRDGGQQRAQGQRQPDYAQQDRRGASSGGRREPREQRSR